jgi:hypothetical protein
MRPFHPRSKTECLTIDNEKLLYLSCASSTNNISITQSHRYTQPSKYHHHCIFTNEHTITSSSIPAMANRESEERIIREREFYLRLFEDGNVEAAFINVRPIAALVTRFHILVRLHVITHQSTGMDAADLLLVVGHLDNAGLLQLLTRVRYLLDGGFEARVRPLMDDTLAQGNLAAFKELPFN